MGKLYEWGYNPFQDYLFNLIVEGADISTLDVRNKIDYVFQSIIEHNLNNKKDIIYLDFDIISDDNAYELIPNNLICGLWFSGIIPDDVDDVLEKGYFIYGDLKYTFDEIGHKIEINELKQ